MIIFSRRLIFSILWVYSLLIFFLSCQELVAKAGEIDYWGRIWGIAFPGFVVIGIIGLIVSALLLFEWLCPSKDKLVIISSTLRNRLGRKAWILATVTAILVFELLWKNPWPWIFRWTYTRQFVFLYAAATITFLMYPLLMSCWVRLWTQMEQIKLRADKVFLILAGSFGLIYFLIIPPFMAPDEVQHLWRSWAVSENALFQDRFTIPASFTSLQNLMIPLIRHPERKVATEQLYALLHTPLKPDQQVTTDYAPAGVYPPFVYFPQAAGILIGRTLNLSPLLVYYFGRLTNYLVWVLLIFSAIRVAPIYKWVLLSLAFLPMSFFMAVSLSPDALTNGVSFLATAVILQFISGYTTQVTKKDMLLIYGVFFFVALTKIPYFLLTFSFFLIPWKKFGSKRNYLTKAVLLFALVGIVVFFANLASYNSLLSQGRVFTQVQPPAQKMIIVLNHPFTVFRAVLNTVWMLYDKNLLSYLGILGWLDIWLPNYVYVVIILALFLIILSDGAAEYDIRLSDRMLLAVLSIGSLLLIIFLMYLSYSPIGIKFVVGFQGRYYIPFGPIVALLLHNRILAHWIMYTRWIIILYLVWLLSEVARVIFLHYYAI